MDDLRESSLDLELMMGLLDSKQEVFLYETGTGTNEPFGTVIFKDPNDPFVV